MSDLTLLGALATCYANAALCASSVGCRSSIALPAASSGDAVSTFLAHCASSPGLFGSVMQLSTGAVTWTLFCLPAEGVGLAGHMCDQGNCCPVLICFHQI